MTKLPDPNTYTDPIRYFRDCHGIISNELMKLQAMIKEAEEIGVAKYFEKYPEFRDLISFFTHISQQHEREEETTLFPLLKEKLSPIGFQTPRTTPDFLVKAHERLNYRARLLARSWEEYVHTGKVTPEAEQLVLLTTNELFKLYSDHINEENNLIYRVANDDLLSPEERIEVMDKIQALHSPQSVTQVLTYDNSIYSEGSDSPNGEE